MAEAHERSKSEDKSKPLTSAFNLFTPSVNMLKLNLPTFLVLLVVPILLATAGAGITHNGDYSSAHYGDTNGLLMVIGYILMFLTAPGLLFAQLLSVQKKTIEPKAAFLSGLPFLWRLLGLGIVMGIIYVVAFLLLIVPFFIVLPRYILAPYYLLDQKLSIREALKASAADASKYSGPIWGLIGVSILLSLANILPVIGWIVSATLSILYAGAAAIRYEQIKAAQAGKSPITPIEKVA